MLAPHRAEGPGGRRKNQQGCTQRARLQVGAEVEHDDADHSERNASPFETGITRAPEIATEQGKQRHRCHRQSGHSRSHAGVFGHADRSVTARQQQYANDPGSLPLRPGRRRRPAPAQKGVHQSPGNDETDTGEQQRRPVLHADADHQVGRAPNHIQGEEGSDQG
ncbi:hypothetical protein D3C71_1485560 [compost metagenome]